MPALLAPPPLLLRPRVAGCWTSAEAEDAAARVRVRVPRAAAIATGRAVAAKPSGGISVAGGVSSIGRELKELGIGIISTSGRRSSSVRETCKMSLFLDGFRPTKN